MMAACPTPTLLLVGMLVRMGTGVGMIRRLVIPARSGRSSDEATDGGWALYFRLCHGLRLG